MSSTEQPRPATHPIDQNELTTTMRVLQARAILDEATGGSTTVRRQQFNGRRVSWMWRLLNKLRGR